MRAYLCLQLIATLVACYKDGSKHVQVAVVDPPASPVAMQVVPSSQRFLSSRIQTWEDVGDLAADVPMIQPELKDNFCINVYRLPFKADFVDLLAYLCVDKKPTEMFDKIDRYAGRVGSNPRSIKLAVDHAPDGFTHGTFIVAYRVPIALQWMRTSTIPKYMVATSDFDYVKLSGAVTDDLNSTLGGDLQFGKWRMQARMDVTTPAGTSFSNSRVTEMNSFQVEGGNPDMGIGTEHLIATPNSAFKDYRTATISMSNTDQSAVLITLISVSILHNGFPETAEQVSSDITTALATQVHDGLMAEYSTRAFNSAPTNSVANP